MVAPSRLARRDRASARLTSTPEWAYAALLFAFGALLFAWPTLIGGRLFYPALTNPVLSDVVDVLQPWAGYAREMIHDGQFPAWNPYTLSGTPFYANPQAVVTSPFSLPIWLLPFKYGIVVSAALKLWVGAMGAYALVRTLGLRFLPAVVAGIAFGFLPYAVMWVQFPHTAVWSLLPWMVAATERIVAHGRPRDAALLAIAAALSFISGHPESAAHVAALTGLYALVRVFQLGKDVRVRRLGLAVVGGVTGALLAGFALVPIAFNLHDAAWAQGRAAQGAFHLPFTSWHTLFFPDWWGRPTRGGTAPDLPYNYNENTVYVGAAALALAAIGVATTSWRRTLPWLVFVVIGVSAALGIHPVSFLLSHLPPFDMAMNTRLTFGMGLGVAVLAAFGVQRLLEVERVDKRIVIAAAAVVGIGLVTFAFTVNSFQDVKLLQNHLRTRTLWPQITSLTSVGYFLIFTGAVLLLVLVRRWASAVVVAVLLAAVVAVDVGYFAKGYNPFQPDPGPVADSRPDYGPDRVLVTEAQPDRQMPSRLRDIRGYDPPMPRMPYIRLWQRAVPTQGLAGPVNIGGPANEDQQRLISLLSVRTIIGPDGVPQPNREGARRVYVPANVRSVPDEKRALDAMFRPGFIPGRNAVVFGEAPPAGQGTADIVRERNARVDIRADLQRGGLVVLNDTLDHGWSVSVDGKDAEVLQVNSVMRGVEVPAGRHEISWTYRVPGLRGGLALSLAGLLVTGLLLFRRRKTVA